MAFGIRAFFVVLAIALFMGIMLLGVGSGYVMVTTYGWIPLLATMGVIALGFVALVVVAVLGMQIVEWAMDHSCRL